MLTVNGYKSEKSLEEAAFLKIPREMRVLFAYICVNCNPTNPKRLWEKFRNHMSEDIIFMFSLSTNIELPYQIALHEIIKILTPLGMRLESLGIETPSPLPVDSFNRFINSNVGQTPYDIEKEAEKCNEMKKLLNKAQRKIFDRVEDALINNKSCRIFVDQVEQERRFYTRQFVI